ncbi:lipopolysaccharide assembly protein LapA domain-containing protein [Thiomicrorhabdus sp. Milos-T2]|uniref:lipopolysaccharide assembly protein LapA domain-containing protein n=1 Tax=Thiomicrorhabdus sp. Milos-T2 TaxID=90814 RepID=UPI00056DC5FC|nr:LapA family protein [Thiomicrorhabdus sp. Milos-T2]
MLKLFSLLFIISFLIIGVVLGVLNPTSVELNLLITSVNLPLSVIMAVLFIIGLVVGAAIISMQVIRLRWIVRQKTKQNLKLSDQIIQLKKANIQVKESSTKESNQLVSLEK